MNIYTSYFYQIRFFPPNLIPLSTAVGDPKWFHDNKGQQYKFKDKRGVINGMRIEPFMPGEECSDLCRGPETCNSKPPMCRFLLTYRAQLNKLDFVSIMERFNILADKIKTKEHFNDVDFALIVHEAPTKQCSERGVIQAWFKDNGVLVPEWYKI